MEDDSFFCSDLTSEAFLNRIYFSQLSMQCLALLVVVLTIGKSKLLLTSTHMRSNFQGNRHSNKHRKESR